MKTGHYGIDISEEIVGQIDKINNDQYIQEVLRQFLKEFATDDHTAFSNDEIRTIGKFLSGFSDILQAEIDAQEKFK